MKKHLRLGLLVILAIGFGISAYQIGQHFELVRVVRAQSHRGFTARQTQYFNAGKPDEVNREARTVTVASDGSRLETHSIPGKPLEDSAIVYLSSPAAGPVIALAKLGMAMRLPDPPLVRVAAALSARNARVQTNCADEAKRELVIGEEVLLGKLRTFQVQAWERSISGTNMRAREWRAPEYGCALMQAVVLHEIAGDWVEKATLRLESFEPISLGTITPPAYLSALRTVSHAEFVRAVMEYQGIHCPECLKSLLGADE